MAERFLIIPLSLTHAAPDTISSDFFLKRCDHHTAGALVRAACVPHKDEPCP
jgi:hypothetical protein